MADSTTVGRANRWVLTPEALEGLLELLGPDRDAAGRKYEQIRVKLNRIFEWRGCRFPEELVDETMNRVAHKVAAGVEVRSEDPFRYFCGVAQMVFKEVLRDERRKREALGEVRYAEETAREAEPEPGDDERLGCLQQCMDELPDDHRRLILTYYEGEGGRRIRQRKKLAAELGVAMNALRIRAFRLRSQLEQCVRECAAMK